jgi:hypothetical protein
VLCSDCRKQEELQTMLRSSFPLHSNSPASTWLTHGPPWEHAYVTNICITNICIVRAMGAAGAALVLPELATAVEETRRR